MPDVRPALARPALGRFLVYPEGFVSDLSLWIGKERARDGGGRAGVAAGSGEVEDLQIHDRPGRARLRSRPLVRRYPREPPQGRKAARVSGL
ncbi:hypothetical protein FRAAL0613 [Frankia alni ACN14a]|uniref:Uncharacterized protein n=1 Tax=Frankia alni (strain DSM 45986 / CECT 9034 / ACN14a) TaxID=326424 RepID=Q0RT16_FRAAA|nr:hypothetical protein FRAAL0613 [Frankia alni ACN14a]